MNDYELERELRRREIQEQQLRMEQEDRDRAAENLRESRRLNDEPAGPTGGRSYETVITRREANATGFLAKASYFIIPVLVGYLASHKFGIDFKTPTACALTAVTVLHIIFFKRRLWMLGISTLYWGMAVGASFRDGLIAGLIVGLISQIVGHRWVRKHSLPTPNEVETFPAGQFESWIFHDRIAKIRSRVYEEGLTLSESYQAQYFLEQRLLAPDSGQKGIGPRQAAYIKNNPLAGPNEPTSIELDMFFIRVGRKAVKKLYDRGRQNLKRRQKHTGSRETG